jgi:hypothetical protein
VIDAVNYLLTSPCRVTPFCASLCPTCEYIYSPFRPSFLSSLSSTQLTALGLNCQVTLRFLTMSPFSGLAALVDCSGSPSEYDYMREIYEKDLDDMMQESAEPTINGANVLSLVSKRDS